MTKLTGSASVRTLGTFAHRTAGGSPSTNVATHRAGKKMGPMRSRTPGPPRYATRGIPAAVILKDRGRLGGKRGNPPAKLMFERVAHNER